MSAHQTLSQQSSQTAELMEKAMVGERDGRSCRDAVAGLEVKSSSWKIKPSVQDEQMCTGEALAYGGRAGE